MVEDAKIEVCFKDPKILGEDDLLADEKNPETNSKNIFLLITLTLISILAINIIYNKKINFLK